MVESPHFGSGKAVCKIVSGDLVEHSKFLKSNLLITYQVHEVTMQASLLLQLWLIENELKLDGFLTSSIEIHEPSRASLQKAKQCDSYCITRRDEVITERT